MAMLFETTRERGSKLEEILHHLVASRDVSILMSIANCKTFNLKSNLKFKFTRSSSLSSSRRPKSTDVLLLLCTDVLLLLSRLLVVDIIALMTVMAGNPGCNSCW